MGTCPALAGQASHLQPGHRPAPGQADALVTGDSDLLVMADTVSVPILTPAVFRDRLREGPWQRDQGEPRLILLRLTRRGEIRAACTDSHWRFAAGFGLHLITVGNFVRTVSNAGMLSQLI